MDEYMESIDPRWKDMIINLRRIILENLPDGFEETMSYGMIGYVVPHSIYPKGYHTDPKQPLPFINMAAQKNNISLYHYGIYGEEKLTEWFVDRYKEEIGKKPDMGRSCIRFKREEEIPFRLLEELLERISVEEFISHYEKAMKKK